MLNWLFPRKYHEDGREMTAREESALWAVNCSQCDYSTSVAAMGGVRYRAQGVKWRTLACPSCAQRRPMRIFWNGPPFR